MREPDASSSRRNQSRFGAGHKIGVGDVSIPLKTFRRPPGPRRRVAKQTADSSIAAIDSTIACRSPCMWIRLHPSSPLDAFSSMFMIPWRALI